jgi:hypothetical protein
MNQSKNNILNSVFLVLFVLITIIQKSHTQILQYVGEYNIYFPNIIYNFKSYVLNDTDEMINLNGTPEPFIIRVNDVKVFGIN